MSIALAVGQIFQRLQMVWDERPENREERLSTLNENAPALSKKGHMFVAWLSSRLTFVHDEAFSCQKFQRVVPEITVTKLALVSCCVSINGFTLIRQRP